MKNEKETAILSIPKEISCFNSLYEEYFAQLVKFAEAIVFDSEEAKDIVQEVFFHLWDNADKIKITTSISGYLFTSVKNKALNHIKSVRITDVHNERIKEAYLYACYLEPESDDELLTRVYSEIENFPAQMKKVLLLRTEKNMKYDEIAKLLNLSKNTVKTHLKNAFRLLREKLIPASLILLFLLLLK